MKVEMFSLFDSTLIHTQEVIRLAAAMLEGKQKKEDFSIGLELKRHPEHFWIQRHAFQPLMP